MLAARASRLTRTKALARGPRCAASCFVAGITGGCTPAACIPASKPLPVHLLCDGGRQCEVEQLEGARAQAAAVRGVLQDKRSDACARHIPQVKKYNKGSGE